MSAGWFTPAQLAALRLPGLPTTAPRMREVAETEGWRTAAGHGVLWRVREGRGGGFEYAPAALPSDAQAALALRMADEGTPPAPRERAPRSADWAWFEGLPTPKRTAAGERARALDALARLCGDGKPRTIAAMVVARETGVAVSTLYAWDALVAGVPRPDWLPALAPRHAGAQARADCSPEAWEMLRADYLRPERPTLDACLRRLERVAAQRGWTLPSRRTLRRRIGEIGESAQVLAREGTDALKALFPAQERTRGHFHALQAVNADGHRWDVFVRWPDGTVARPVMIAWQDLYSGKILAWRVDQTENKEATRLSFGDLVEEFGIPDRAWLDNGRQFASKWITGGAPNRYRFKVRDEEPLGLLTLLGVEPHWTMPYSGQSKPIERAFRDFATDTAKHPRFAGAWTGNNPMAKPENYQSAAVPLDVFLATIAEEIAAHNARPGRRTAVCGGVKSFDQAFAESYAQAPIRRAAPAQRRTWLLAAEGVRAAKRDGSLTLEGNRFWAPFLTPLRGHRVTARFDPAALQADLHVYALDGRYLGAAECIEAVGFDDIEAARAHARARGQWMRAQRAMLDAERRLTPAQVADLLPAPALPDPPARRVVRLAHAGAATARRLDELPEQSDAERRLLAGMRKLRLVQTEDENG